MPSICAASRGERPTSAQDNKALVRRAFAETNRGSLDFWNGILADGFTYRDPAQPRALGKEGYKQYLASIRVAWPDVHCTLAGISAEGDTVTVRWTFLGTQEGESRGISPTGKKVLMTGMHIYHFRSGQAENLWANWDTLGYLQQLGAIQSLESESN